MFNIKKDKILCGDIYKQLQYYHQSELNIRNYFDRETADKLINDLRKNILDKIEEIILNEE
jgi:hypothetical protein